MNEYADFVEVPEIRNNLIEIRNRDYNLTSCQIYRSGSVNGKPKYMVSYPSSMRKDTATEPEDLDFFCMFVSAGNRFWTIEEKIEALRVDCIGYTKRARKIKAQEAKFALLTCPHIDG